MKNPAQTPFQIRRPYDGTGIETTFGTLVGNDKRYARVERHGYEHFVVGWATELSAVEALDAMTATLSDFMPDRTRVSATTQLRPTRGIRRGSHPVKHFRGVRLGNVSAKILGQKIGETEAFGHVEIISKLGEIAWSHYNPDTPSANEMYVSIDSDASSTPLLAPLFARTAVDELQGFDALLSKEVRATKQRLQLGGELARAFQQLADRLGKIAVD